MTPRTSKKLGLAPVLAVAMLFGGGALAQISKEWGQCTGGEGGNADTIINGCTAIIVANKDAPNRIAIALNNRAVAFKSKGEFDRALEDYDKSIRLNPNRANTHNNLGVIYRIKGDYQRAIEEYDKAILLRSNYLEAFYNRALANTDLGKYDAAISDFSFVIRLNPDNAYALYGRGTARFKQGDAAGGASDIAAARTIDPNIAQEFKRPGAGSF